MPILRVYPSNSFSKECEKAKDTYTQRSGGHIRSITEVIGQKNILNYLSQKQSGKFNEEVYLDYIKAFRLKVENLNCIEDCNIASYIRNNTDESIRTARKATSPFLKINRIFTPSPYLPRFVVGADQNDITNVLAAFRNQNYNDFPDTIDGKKELNNLKNIIVFYDEKGNFIPLNDLSYINLMKDTYENVPSGLADGNITSARWKSNRSAYTTS